MKTVVVVLSAGLVTQGPVSPRPSPLKLEPACVATERMPIAGLHGMTRDPMPVARVDSTWHNRMPVSRLMPCYLLDSARAPRQVGPR